MFTFPVMQCVFFFFSIVTILSALMVVLLRHPVRSVLSLVLCFFSSAVLWMLLQAEFLSLMLIFVYVGAVMTLFLFVVMMLNISISTNKHFVSYLPFAVLAAVLLIGTALMVLGPLHFKAGEMMPVHYGAHYSNVKAMGLELYTHFLYAFELAALILLVAMVAAITLAYRGRRQGTKVQAINEQLRASKKDRLRVLDLKENCP